MSGVGDDLLRAYLRGELDDAAVSSVEAELAAKPDLSVSLRRVARDEVKTLLERPVDDPVESIRTTMSLGIRGAAPSIESLSRGRLELGEILGKGGMGVVHLGHQPHLGRTVAVKSVNAPKRERVRALLSEAFVTGQLEHPNIVPIHDIIFDDDKKPQVVLKHIEGSSWRDLLGEPNEVRQRFDVEDTLAWHLRALLSVCQALRFAHSRGIIHRDVKPSNVMIGRFGEIYLLDWGLAMRAPGEIQSIDQPELSIGFGGSPAYMAPEQFAPDMTGIGPHTDVYLVGATLFEILTGRPPRKGKDLAQHLAESLAGPPPLGPDAPPELAEIVTKAMAPKPEDRFGSVQEIRIAIESFLEHRASRLLATKAEKSALALRAAHDAGDEAAAERAFAEATFGYRAALDAWPENRDAKAALDALLTQRIEDALSTGAVETAERLLALGPDLSEQLKARVHAAAAEHAKRKRELERIASDTDRATGVATRRVLMLIIFGGWVGWWVYAGVRYPMDPLDMAIGPAIVATGGTVLAFLARRRLSSRSNQALVGATIAMMLATVSWLVGAAQLGLDPAEVPLSLPLLWALGSIIGSLAIDRRSLPASIGFAVGFHIAAADASNIRWVLGATSAFWLANALVVNILVARDARRAAAR